MISFETDEASRKLAAEMFEHMQMRARKAIAKETDSNVAIRNLSVITTEALVSI